jgi:hypothetical protein
MDYRFRSACVKKLAQSFSLELVAEIEKHRFSPLNNSEGFVLLESVDKNEFYFQYLRKITITYGDYQNEFIKKKGETIKETFFKIDLKQMLILIYAGKSQSDFLIRKLENICGDSFIFI